MSMMALEEEWKWGVLIISVRGTLGWPGRGSGSGY